MNAAVQRLWLVRHAPVAGASGVIHAPDAPADLSAQAHIARRATSLPREAAAWCSPSRRTVDTARALGLAATACDAFREQDFGAWTGRRHADLARASGTAYVAFWQAPDAARPPAGESFREQVRRVDAGLRRLDGPAHVLIVHSGTIRAVLALALGGDTRLALRFVVDPLSLTRVDRIGTDWRIVSVNEPVENGG